jgi:hypothetical protein
VRVSRRSVLHGDHHAATSIPELTSRKRPLCVGSSIGTRSGVIGSIGVFAMRERRRGFVTSPAALGVFGSDMLGVSVFQPGAAGDAGLSERTRIGTLTAVDIGPTWYGGAFVELFEEVEADTALPIQIGAWNDFTGVADPSKSKLLGRVAKIGCATGLTFGITSGTDSTQEIQLPDGHFRRFDDLLEIRATFGSFSLPGDGGAAVFDPVTGSVLGLVVAGADGPDPPSYAVPLLPVLQRLGAKLLLQ